MNKARFIFYVLFVASALAGYFVCQRLASVKVSELGEQQGEITKRSVGANGQHSIELLSIPYRLDRVYKSMLGPSGNQACIRLSEEAEDNETLWLTGVKTEIVDAETCEPISNEYFCHSNLTLNPDTTDPRQHNQSFDVPNHAEWRLFTLIPGRMEIRLPVGFGVRVKNATLLDYYTMALNQNPGRAKRDVRMKTRLSFLRSADSSMRALFRRAVYCYQQHLSVADVTLASTAGKTKVHQGEECAETCKENRTGSTHSVHVSFTSSTGKQHPGAACCVGNASLSGIVPQFGEENTVHWMVPPGRHQYRTEVTEQMQLPFDTTAHYVTGHLHPFGKSLRLVDIESEQTVFEISSRDYTDRLGVAHMSEVVSENGIAVHKDRRYELIVDYDNTTSEAIDAMGILYIYALDQRLQNSQ